ncbi:MAG: TAXI family TRAP transporter solute-binding subunit [Microbacterium sp.]
MHPRVRFQADWGGANLTRVSGWLAQWLWEQTDGRIRSAILNGRGMGDNLRALTAGEVDIAVLTPTVYAAHAHAGTGPYEGAPATHLRGLAVLPHRDAMIAVARAGLGFARLSDAAGAGPLRVGLGLGGPDGFMGHAAEVLLDAAGIPVASIQARGGTLVRHESPFDVLGELIDGNVDLAISEAVMAPAWQRLSGVVHLGLDDAEALAVRAAGFDTFELESGRLPGQRRALQVLDYSGWAVLTTDALDDEVAALIARAVCTHAGAIERHYRHLPVEASPLTYPVTATDAARMPLPLHPAAAAEYDRHGAR